MEAALRVSPLSCAFLGHDPLGGFANFHARTPVSAVVLLIQMIRVPR